MAADRLSEIEAMIAGGHMRDANADTAWLIAALHEAREYIEESENTREHLADILTRTANALKGAPAPLTHHSWHDLPEAVEALHSEVANWRSIAGAAESDFLQMKVERDQARRVIAQVKAVPVALTVTDKDGPIDYINRDAMMNALGEES